MDSASSPSDALTTTPASARRSRSRRALLLAIAAPLLLAGCEVPTFGANRGVTGPAHNTFKLWQGFSIAAIVIGGGTFLLMVYVILRYRRRSDEIPRQKQYNIPLEILYTVVPIIVVFGLFAATVVVENQVVANPKPDATIDVTAFQWGWKFAYPGTRAVVVGQTTQTPTMVMPADRNVRIELRSTDVIHGFFVPAFNFDRYAQPGFLNTFTFNATKTGLFKGQCTQLCGLYHSLMYFQVRVVTPAQFAAWIRYKNATTPLSTALAGQGAVALQTNPRIATNPAGSQGDN